MLKINHHRAELGVINNRIEKHGDQNVTAFDCPITLLLNPDQFDELLGTGRHDHWFKKVGRSFEPLNQEIESFSLRYDLNVTLVTLSLDKSELEFEDCRLKSLTLEPLQGGETSLRFKLQIRPQNKHILRLLDAQNRDLRLSIDDATIAERSKDKQGQLELGENGDTAQKNGDKARPRKPNADKPTAPASDTAH